MQTSILLFIFKAYYIYTNIFVYYLYDYMILSIVYYLVSIETFTFVTGEVYCFPRRQLIFSFGKRVTMHPRPPGRHIGIDG